MGRRRARWLGAIGILTLLSGVARAEPAACPTFVAASQGLPTRGEWRTRPALGDIDGDGHLDLAGNPRKAQAGAWFGDGAGHWKAGSAGLLVPGLSCGIGVDLADVDGDGDLELGIADHCQGVHVYRYAGKGAWQLLANPPRHRLHGGFDDLQFGDVDGDGHADIVATGAMRGGFGVLHGDGKGNWTPAQTNLPTLGYAPDVELADIDADGDLDIAAAFTSDEPGPTRTLPRHPVVWLNEGEGRFRSFSDGLPSEGDFRGVALGDLNGDGFLDLVISAGTWPGRPPLLVYLASKEKGGWEAAPGGHPESPEGEVIEGIELADLDADGLLDLVAVSHMDAGLRVWRGKGLGGFERCADAGLPGGHEDVRGWGVAVGDVNGDGRPDLAYAYGRAHNGALEAWIQRRRP
jgi:hypothetical protein